MKVVINTCYGGFSLSTEAMLEYARRKGVVLYPSVRSYGVNEFVKWTPYAQQDEFVYFFTKLDANGIPVVDSHWYPEIERDDPDLVSVVEEMGKAANGFAAKLKVVKIPDDVEYTIEEYDGNEWIAEKHRTWR